ncbi:uncharacterized protein LOC106163223 [Lingula anatina]|uniref:Uncharacterized protein LOC106163223 n=1 Tax=Lingula anatina TaxID=7574 RepID=A0A1S3ID55_LINAN|nr:uncharacterized protein LOC106163223 [Lingula anatina]|eukprot:XP_013396195.1 uncharacterized protein LOC106163223 [Lingula anatina]
MLFFNPISLRNSEMLVRISKKGDHSIIADDHCRLGTPPTETPPPRPPPTPPPLSPTDSIDDLAQTPKNLRISLFELKDFVQNQELLQETEAPCVTPETPSTPPPIMNFDIFKDNVETSLERDVKVTRKSINPLELYLKSNPNLLSDKNSKRKEKRFRFTKLGAVTAVPVLPAINAKNPLPQPPTMRRSPPPRMQRAGSDPGYRLPKMSPKYTDGCSSGGSSARRVSSVDMVHLSGDHENYDFDEEGFLLTSSAPVSNYKRLW